VTLPVSTASTERAFSTFKIIRLHSKMEDGFLANSLLVNIEREITERTAIRMFLRISRAKRNDELICSYMHWLYGDKCENTWFSILFVLL
jgi:hypothetical protein